MTIDTGALKRDHPVEQIVEGYGIELHVSGRSLLGRCPFHDDGGRPNLHVYPSTQSWYCYRCSVGGDVVSFVQRMERVSFRDAVVRITGDRLETPKATIPPVGKVQSRVRHFPPWGPDERACLSAAVELYHNRLLTDVEAHTYVRGRGLDERIIERCRLGYAAGDELAAYLRWRRLPVQAAVRVGLLRPDGHEFLAGRVVVPEIRHGQPIWLVGRTIGAGDDAPKYLGLPGRKPLLGWDTAMNTREIFVVEGVFDWLTLLGWSYPALALVGTHIRVDALKALTRFERIYLVLDNDRAGQTAAVTLASTLGSRAVIVNLPRVKDVAELATVPEGRDIFSRAISQDDLARAA
jgi:DNA primase